MPIQLVNTFEGGTNGARPVAGSGNGTGEQNGNSWDGVNGNTGTVLYSNAVSKQGTMSLKIQTDGLAVVGVHWDENSLNNINLTTYLRFYFYLEALPSTTTRWVFLQDAGAVSIHGIVNLRPDGRVDLLDGNAVVRATSATTLATGRWYRLEMKIFSSNTSGSMEVRLFGGANLDGATPTETVSFSNQFTHGNHVRWVHIGASNVVSGLSFWLDSVEYNDYDWPGPFAPPVPRQYDTLFANGRYPFQTPKIINDDNDTSSYSFGMFFTPSVAGKVYGAAWCNNIFATSAEGSVTPQIGLYPGGSSTAIATKTTTVAERRGNWNYDLFTTPLDVAAGTQYMIVVFRKHYGFNPYYFDVSNGGHGVQKQGPLTAPDATTSDNCYFDTGVTIAKPASKFHSTWYGIDVLFVPNGPAKETWGVPV